MSVLILPMQWRFRHAVTHQYHYGLLASNRLGLFKDPMTTAAAIDRLVHHSVILELNLSSFRLEASQKPTTKKKQKP